MRRIAPVGQITGVATPSLRAQRSNPAFVRRPEKLDCFIASAPRNDGLVGGPCPGRGAASFTLLRRAGTHGTNTTAWAPA